MTLKKEFDNKIKRKLMKDLKVDSIMAVPRPTKVTINIGLGEALKNPKAVENMEKAFALISGQKPVIKKARKDVSGFDVRKGNIVGMMVTLRGQRMWDFIERFLKVVLPRVRDFYGLSEKAFDGSGNYSIGLKEHTAFPEIEPSMVDKVRSMQVCITTTAEDDESGLALLKALGFPFVDKSKKK